MADLVRHLTFGVIMFDTTALLRMLRDLLGPAQLPPPEELLIAGVGNEPSTAATIDELVPLADPAQGCLPQLPLPARTRIWIRIVIFVITAAAMIALLATGLEVAAAAVALIYTSVIAVWVANRLMAIAPRRLA